MKFQFLFCIPFLVSLGSSSRIFEPTWASLDSRPLPEWFDKAKIEIFIHWGLFSVPSLNSEWFWSYWRSRQTQEISDYIEKNFPPNFTYQEFAKDFTAEFFNATQWANLFAKSGAKYVVLTSKHHEGFTLWPSKYSFSWNAKDIGPHRDIIDELGTAVRQANLTFGLYHSLYEWFHPIYLSDRANNFTTQDFAKAKALPELYELVEQYKPSILWSDGDWEANYTYWNSTEFLAWLYNESPVGDEVVVNDRWGADIPCNHGDFYTCTDRYDPGVLQAHKWENAMTIDKKSWGFRRNAVLDDYLTANELITTLARTVSCGGNLLVNVGPTKDGVINPIYEERLTQLGDWLSINGEAIYETSPWTAQNDSYNGNIWYTYANNNVYALVLEWPSDDTVTLQSSRQIFEASANTSVVLLGNEDTKLEWSLTTSQVQIKLPSKAIVKNPTAWVLKIISG
ncbi:alpha-L-fucosidase-like isoform X2 [Sitophilus oryzae]|uniref:Putative alpha-L-fucosidase n=1 Tax=Sitophilus oryzae TaxID=7048 RepID=A0A6J2Y2X5_SITOR|nr:alpha-L-fucosidase-like isoform X2 [Sitophilus oryzae]